MNDAEDQDTVVHDAATARTDTGDPVDEPVAPVLDGLLDLVVVGLAVWTIWFQIALLTGLTRNVTFILWLGTTGAGAMALPSMAVDRACLRPHGGTVSVVKDPLLLFHVLCLAVLAVVVIEAEPTGRHWVLPWALVCISLGLALGRLLRRRTETAPAETAFGAASAASWQQWAVVAAAVALAILSLVTVRPDEDDVFLVNRSTHVESDDGAFPERDTIFSDEVFRSERPPAPQTAVEALIGSVAATLPASAATTTYLLVGPAVSFLFVAATWRLLRRWLSHGAAVATLLSVAFVLLDGASHASFGNLNFARSWQGKVIFLLVIVPSLWTHALDWCRAGRPRSLVLLVTASVAGLGLTTSATFVTPVIVVVIAAAAVLGAPEARRRASWSLLALVPPTIAALVNTAADPQPVLATAFGFIDVGALLDSRVDPATQLFFVFGDGPAAVLALGAALLAWVAVADPLVRRALVIAPLAVFVGFLTPGALDLLDDVASSDAVTWRVLWVLPVPAAVGALGAACLRERHWLLAVPVLALVVLISFGTPVTSSANGTELVWPPRVDLPEPERAAALRLIELTPPDGVAASPQRVGFPLAVVSATAHPVNPRWTYMTGSHAVPEFLSADRQLLSVGLETGIPEDRIADTVAALAQLEVASACQYRTSNDFMSIALVGAGLTRTTEDGLCLYWQRE